MRDEEVDSIDELIREASKSHHPAYDDKAWEKMEALLNEHLPVKKDRKRPAIFFLLLLFIIAAGLFVRYQRGDHREVISEETNPANIQLKATVASEQHYDQNSVTIPQDKSINKVAPGVEKGSNKATAKKGDEPPGHKSLTVKNGLVTIHARAGSAEFTDVKSKYSDGDIVSTERGPTKQMAIIDPSNEGLNNHLRDLDIQIAKPDRSGSSLQKDTANPQAVVAQEKSPLKPASKRKFTNNFGITLSAGPDISFVEPGNTGKTRLNYGVGLSYIVAKKITLRTGFFIAKKTYPARGGDYHPPDWYWTYNVKLKKVDADCNIYEVPLSAIYNFKQSKNHSWFAGVGFSTLFMKRETYNYLYNDSLGQPKRRTWTLRNGEQHYLSVFTISGGYQYRINEKITLMAEPYFKLPLHGIGFGKIKLNSGGAMLTASIKPFAKKSY